MNSKGYCKNNQVTFKFGDLATSIPVERTPVDIFYKEEHESKDGDKCYSFHDPIRMLFNQERLNMLGPAAVQKWLEQLSVAKSSPINELRQHCDDKMLMTLIKSRHIQSLSELQAYANCCKSDLDGFKSEVQKMAAFLQAQEAEQKAKENQPVKVEPKPE